MDRWQQVAGRRALLHPGGGSTWGPVELRAGRAPGVWVPVLSLPVATLSAGWTTSGETEAQESGLTTLVTRSEHCGRW